MHTQSYRSSRATDIACHLQENTLYKHARLAEQGTQLPQSTPAQRSMPVTGKHERLAEQGTQLSQSTPAQHSMPVTGKHAWNVVERSISFASL